MHHSCWIVRPLLKLCLRICRKWNDESWISGPDIPGWCLNQKARCWGCLCLAASCTFCLYQWDVDVSVYINSDSYRHGIGRALYTALCVLRRLGYFNAYAGISLLTGRAWDCTSRSALRADRYF
jgi:hypothetical protein